MTEEEQLISQYEDEILDLIDNQNEYTRSDLQGIVSVLVKKIVTNTKKQGKEW